MRILLGSNRVLLCANLISEILFVIGADFRGAMGAVGPRENSLGASHSEKTLKYKFHLSTAVLM